MTPLQLADHGQLMRASFFMCVVNPLRSNSDMAVAISVRNLQQLQGRIGTSAPEPSSYHTPLSKTALRRVATKVGPTGTPLTSNSTLSVDPSGAALCAPHLHEFIERATSGWRRIAKTYRSKPNRYDDPPQLETQARQLSDRVPVFSSS